MKDEHGAQKACEDKKPLIDGRRANVQLAYLGAKKKTKDGKGISYFSTCLVLFSDVSKALHNSWAIERICIALKVISTLLSFLHL